MTWYYTDEELAGLASQIKTAAATLRRIEYRFAHRQSKPTPSSLTDYKRRRRLAFAYPSDYFRLSHGSVVIYIDKRADSFFVASYDWISDGPLLSQLKDSYPDAVLKLYPKKKSGDVPFFEFGPFSEFSDAERAWISVVLEYLSPMQEPL